MHNHYIKLDHPPGHTHMKEREEKNDWDFLRDHFRAVNQSKNLWAATRPTTAKHASLTNVRIDTYFIIN